MLQTLKTLVIIAVLIYLGICALLYAKQRALIYHPQPKQATQVPSLQLQHEGQTLQVSVHERAGAQAVLYFGGNAEDVSYAVPQLAAVFPQAAIYAMHYRGYGGSTGEPSEAALVGDARALYALLRQKHADITVIGRSLGSGLAVQLAAGGEKSASPRKLILVTPYSSIADVAADSFWWVPVRWLLQDHFDSVAHAPQLSMPTLLIKAEHDQVIPAWSSDKLAAAVPEKLRSVKTVAAADHNSIGVRAEYLQFLTSF